MMNPAEAVNAMDYAIGYAMMRAMLGAEMRTIPAPVLARTLGVPVEDLTAFMDGGEPGGALWEAGHAYAGGREPPEMEPVDIALNLLADTFPLAERVRVRKALADVLRPALASLCSEVAR
jgi:hypothetical protein